MLQVHISIMHNIQVNTKVYLKRLDLKNFKMWGTVEIYQTHKSKRTIEIASYQSLS